MSNGNSHIQKTMNPNNDEPKVDDGDDSDESISTEELNKLQSEVDEVFKKDKEEPVKQVEPKKDISIDIPKDVEKSKPKKLSKKELEEQKRLLEEQLKEYETIEETIDEDKPVKKPRGRPKKSEEQKKEEKLAKKTIIKEKIIYMVKDENDEYKPVKNAKPLSKYSLKKLEQEKKILEQEAEIGKRIVRTKKGKADQRCLKPRTDKQIAHCKKLVEMMRSRREDKAKKTNKRITDNIKTAIVEVVSQPMESVKATLPNYKPPVKSINQQYNDFFS
tara:strand:- start:1609 stop:2433 length:825 start_codon:yes stop_codon:yes gene_type:complete